MKKNGRLLIVFALVVTVMIIAQSQIAWADFTSGLSSSPAQNDIAKVYPQETPEVCPDVVILGEEHKSGEWCVGSISDVVLEDIDELIQSVAAKIEEDVYPDMLAAISGITFPDGLAFPDSYGDLDNFPPGSFDEDLLSSPTLFIHSIMREDGTEEYVGDVTAEGYNVDDFKVCYPEPLDKDAYIAFFSISGDPIQWGDGVILDTTKKLDANGNPVICANAPWSGRYIVVYKSIFQGTAGGSCPDVIIRDEEHELNNWCVGNISELEIEDIDMVIQSVAAKFAEHVYPEILEAISDITFPDDLVFPADYDDLSDFPPPSFDEKLLSMPTLLIYTAEREGGVKEYVADVTDEGYTVDDFKVCYPELPDRDVYIAFFGISGDPVGWGVKEALETISTIDDDGNHVVCANAPLSGMYVLVEN